MFLIKLKNVLDEHQLLLGIRFSLVKIRFHFWKEGMLFTKAFHLIKFNSLSTEPVHCMCNFYRVRIKHRIEHCVPIDMPTKP